MSTETSAPASSAKRKTTAVKIKPGLTKAKASGPQTRYWVGTMPDCPLQNIEAGGISFPRFRDNPNFSDLGVPDREMRWGDYIDLSDDQVKKVKAGIVWRVLRITGGGGQQRAVEGRIGDSPDKTKRQHRNAQMFMADAKRYVAAPNDEPLARYVFMHRMKDMSAEDIQTYPPESMEER